MKFEWKGWEVKSTKLILMLVAVLAAIMFQNQEPDNTY